MKIKLPSIIVPITLIAISYVNPRVGVSLFMGIAGAFSIYNFIGNISQTYQDIKLKINETKQ